MPKVTGQQTIRIPKLATLRQYGLSEIDWCLMWERQNGICPVCENEFGDRKLVVDHEHVKGFKARKWRKSKKGKRGEKKDIRLRVMSPEERRQYVRGILHAWCNGYVRKWLTLERAQSIVRYLEEHQKRGRKHDP